MRGRDTGRRIWPARCPRRIPAGGGWEQRLDKLNGWQPTALAGRIIIEHSVDGRTFITVRGGYAELTPQEVEELREKLVSPFWGREASGD